MKWLLPLLLFPSITFATTSPNTIKHDVEKIGGNFSENIAPSDWQFTLKNIAAGKKEWLDIVPSLAKVMSKEKASELEHALADALPINTKDTLFTLSLLDSSSYDYMDGTNLVCILPIITPTGNIDEYYKNTRLALLDYKQGANCLWLLESSYEEVKQDNGKAINQ